MKTTIKNERTPWTVSVAAFPGEARCPELERLDRALTKDRVWRHTDELIDEWKGRIEWVPFYGEPAWMMAAFPNWPQLAGADLSSMPCDETAFTRLTVDVTGISPSRMIGKPKRPIT